MPRCDTDSCLILFTAHTQACQRCYALRYEPSDLDSVANIIKL